MSGDRFVVAGLAHVRSPWFARVAQWATGGVAPVEFVKCVSAVELRTRIESDRPFSAALIDGNLHDVDHDLVDTLRARRIVPIVVTPPDRADRWSALGLLTVDPDFTARELVTLLGQHARTVPRSADVPPVLDPTASPPDRAPGQLVVMTGAGGTGASTLAAATAAGFGTEGNLQVLLADFALRADQAMLHDSGEVIPGVQELVEAHRTGRPAADDIVGLTYAVAGRGYRLLLGLRRLSDWTALRPRAFASALHSLLSTFDVVVADVSPDVDGEDTTGSADVEDRHVLARRSVRTADLVVVVGGASMKGLHSLARVAADLADAGVAADRLLPVINHAPRRPRARSEITGALAALCAAMPHGHLMPAPTFVPTVRGVEAAWRDGHPLPSALVAAASQPIRSLLRRAEAGAEPRSSSQMRAGDPQPVGRGSVGAWSDDGEAVA